MRLLVQRVLEAAVTVDGQTTGAIGKGLLVMTGFGDEDGPDFHHSPVFEGMARKLLDLRIFPGEGDRCDKFDRSARDCGADVLLVPQFTLYADCRKGRRPSFSNAGDPAWSREMFDRFTRKVSEESGRPVPTGVFGADMRVHLINWGPVTIWLDSREVLPLLYTQKPCL